MVAFNGEGGNMKNLGFSLKAMPLLGVVVHDLEKEVERYQKLFGVEFLTFTAGVDYHLEYETAGEGDISPKLPQNLRLAVDKDDCFELVEMPGVIEGFRNVHYRVDDIKKATAHFESEGLKLVQVITAGTAKEVVFDASSLNGIRLCLMQYEGDSFAQALAASEPAI